MRTFPSLENKVYYRAPLTAEICAFITFLGLKEAKDFLDSDLLFFWSILFLD